MYGEGRKKERKKAQEFLTVRRHITIMKETWTSKERRKDT